MPTPIEIIEFYVKKALDMSYPVRVVQCSSGLRYIFPLPHQNPINDFWEIFGLTRGTWDCEGSVVVDFEYVTSVFAPEEMPDPDKVFLFEATSWPQEVKEIFR
jgi:hypothetical protein